MIGRQVSHYRVLSQLGAGGMGVIYEAEDVRLGRKVALKFLPDRLAQDAAALERFQREARAASSLNHPNICVIYDIGEAEGHPFIAMELLEGQSLERTLHGAAMPPGRVLDIGTQVADALDAAQAKGIIHRDIKPANIFLTTRGQVKVLDFGLAKLAQEAETLGATAATSPAHLTSPGTALGTIAYMSPEQARGEELDRRTDLFSLGAVLYELATGKHPFPGNTSAVIFDRIMNHAPAAPATLNPELPAEFQRILSKALEKDRDLRYQSAGDLRADLKRLKRETDSGHVPVATAAHPGAAAPAPASSSVIVAAARQHKFGVSLGVLAAILVVLAAGFGVYSLLTREHPAPFQHPTITRVTESGNAFLVAVSPDAKYILYVIIDQRKQSLWLRHVPTSSNTQVVPPEETSYRGVQFSADGNYIYYVRSTNVERTHRVLYRAPVLGGTPAQVVDDIDSDITFSPDSKRLAFLRYNNPEYGKYFLHTVALDGSDDKVLASGPYPGLHALAWSPDGKTIVADDTTHTGGAVAAMVAIDVASGRLRPFVSWKDQLATEPTWYPDGKGLLVLYATRKTEGLQIGYLTYPKGELKRVTNDTNSYSRLSLSRDGQTLGTVMTQWKSNLYRLPGSPPPGVEAVQLTDQQSVGWFRWTADGQLLYAGQGKIYRLPAEGGQPTALIADERYSFYNPAACGSDHIIFAAEPREGAADVNLWIANSDGTNRKPLTSGKEEAVGSCSPDGRWLVYNDEATSQVLRVPVAGGTPLVLFTGQSNFVDISPDGKQVLIVYFGGQPLTRHIMLVDIESGQQVGSVEPELRANAEMRFTPDGKEVAYAMLADGAVNVWAKPLAGGAAHQLTDFKPELRPTGINGFAWSRDGKWLALVRGRGDSDVMLIREPGVPQ